MIYNEWIENICWTSGVSEPPKPQWIDMKFKKWHIGGPKPHNEYIWNGLKSGIAEPPNDIQWLDRKYVELKSEISKPPNCSLHE